ncbi:MAG: flagellar protein FliS [Planctomycetaceae bacterium]
MKPREIYQHQRAAEWTRVDMLIALYDAEIDCLKRCQQAYLEHDTVAWKREALYAERIVVELLAGLDLNFGEIPARLQDLYLFVLNGIATGGKQGLDSSIKVLTELRDAFQAIRLEAIALEQSGEISPAESVRMIDSLA